MIDDPTIFSDIAEAINTEKGYNIQAAFVEKDYYAVRLLNLVNSLTLSNCLLVFAGDICLSKAYQNTCLAGSTINQPVTPGEDVLAKAKEAVGRSADDCPDLVSSEVVISQHAARKRAPVTLLKGTGRVVVIRAIQRIPTSPPKET